MKLSLKPTLAALLAISFVGFAVSAQAEDKPAADKPAEASKADAAPAKPKMTYYSGALGALDKAAKTITIKKKSDEKTFTFTSDTKFNKGGKKATIDDGVVGEPAAVGYLETDGKTEVKTIRFGPKVDKAAAAPKAGAPKAEGDAKPEAKSEDKM